MRLPPCRLIIARLRYSTVLQVIYEDSLVSGGVDAFTCRSDRFSWFVPKRSIYSTPDIITTVSEAATLNSDLHGSIALLIDFSKAYDTLQRLYLLSALRWLGFSPRFVSVVAALRCDTT